MLILAIILSMASCGGDEGTPPAPSHAETTIAAQDNSIGTLLIKAIADGNPDALSEWMMNKRDYLIHNIEMCWRPYPARSDEGAPSSRAFSPIPIEFLEEESALWEKRSRKDVEKELVYIRTTLVKAGFRLEKTRGVITGIRPYKDNLNKPHRLYGGPSDDTHGSLRIIARDGDKYAHVELHTGYIGGMVEEFYRTGKRVEWLKHFNVDRALTPRRKIIGKPTLRALATLENEHYQVSPEILWSANYTGHDALKCMCTAKYDCRNMKDVGETCLAMDVLVDELASRLMSQLDHLRECGRTAQDILKAPGTEDVLRKAEKGLMTEMERKIAIIGLKTQLRAFSIHKCVPHNPPTQE